MVIQYSFNKQYELITLNGESFLNDFGSLTQSLIDTDWSVIQSEIIKWQSQEMPMFCWMKRLIYILEATGCNVVLRRYLENLKDERQVIHEIESFASLKKAADYTFQNLLDEDKNYYKTRFEEIVLLSFGHYGCEHINNLQKAKLVKPLEELSQKYSDKGSFEEFFETNNFQTLLFDEFQHICSGNYIIRKCSNCRDIFWTPQSKQIYCSRVDPIRKKSCKYDGPIKRHIKGKKSAYNYYWEKRTKLFKQITRADNHDYFIAWTKATAPYKELARYDRISLHDMVSVLNKIENELAPTLH